MRPEKPKPKSEKTNPAPHQCAVLGDLTPAFIIWHKDNYSEEMHLMRYHNRIPNDYAHLHGIEVV
jgi:hypothetical protein